MDEDQEIVEAYQKTQMYSIQVIQITNGKVYFHWDSKVHIYVLPIEDIDEITNSWLFGTSYKISLYTYFHKAKTLR